MSIKSLFLTGFLLISQTTFCDQVADQAQFDECYCLMRRDSDENNVIQHINNMSPDVLNMKDRYGFTILHEAVCYNRIAVVDLLLSKMSQKVIDAKDRCRWTALHWATAYNRTEIVILLISKMSLDAISVKNDKGGTALYFAVWYENVELVQLLLSKMSQEAIYAKNNRGFTPLDCAIEQGAKDIADMIRAARQKKTKNIFKKWFYKWY